MPNPPAIPQKRPYVQAEVPGAKAWCACGQSMSQPFCDGSHGGSGLRPVVVQVDTARTVAWCGCKHTKTPPYCDGSHAGL